MVRNCGFLNFENHCSKPEKVTLPTEESVDCKNLELMGRHKNVFERKQCINIGLGGRGGAR